MEKDFMLISDTVKLEKQFEGLLKTRNLWGVYKLDDGCWICRGGFFAEKRTPKNELKERAFRVLGLIDENKDQPRTARKIRALELKKD